MFLMHLYPLGCEARTRYSSCGNENFKCRVTLTSHLVAASAQAFKQGTGTGPPTHKVTLEILGPLTVTVARKSSEDSPFPMQCVRIKAQPCGTRARLGLCTATAADAQGQVLSSHALGLLLSELLGLYVPPCLVSQ